MTPLQENKQSYLKMGKGPEQTLLQRGHREDPEPYAMMLTITSHQRDVNQNHNEIPLHTGQDIRHKKNQQTTKCW